LYGLCDCVVFHSIRASVEARAEDRKYEGKPKPNCEYISSSEIHLSIKKNAAMKNEVQTKQTIPLTSSQEVLIFSQFRILR